MAWKQLIAEAYLFKRHVKSVVMAFIPSNYLLNWLVKVRFRPASTIPFRRLYSACAPFGSANICHAIRMEGEISFMDGNIFHEWKHVSWMEDVSPSIHERKNIFYRNWTSEAPRWPCRFQLFIRSNAEIIANTYWLWCILHEIFVLNTARAAKSDLSCANASTLYKSKPGNSVVKFSFTLTCNVFFFFSSSSLFATLYSHSPSGKHTYWWSPKIRKKKAKRNEKKKQQLNQELKGGKEMKTFNDVGMLFISRVLFIKKKKKN